ncbi:MAG: WYL domain-containing protein [Lentisphaerae bacterium]|nr:WYL domain-containing protein [Lentisphaerota bacterium]
MAKTEHDIFYKPQQHRLFAIDRMLRRPGGATRGQITSAVQAQVVGDRLVAYSRATLRRDLDALQDMGAQIRQVWRFDQGGNRTDCFYEYADMSWTMGKVTVREGDLFAVLLAKVVVERYAGLPIAEDLERVYGHLQSELNNTMTIRTDQLAPIAFAARGEALQRASAKIWKEVLAATTRHRALEIVYRKGWGDMTGSSCAPTTRVVHPYHIVNLCGTWYLVGSHSSKDPSIRQYRIDSILEAKALKERFVLPVNFKIDDLLDTTFGQFIGSPQDVVDVRLRFRKDATPLIKGREFQPYQRMQSLPDGGVELTLRVSQSGPLPLHHVAAWVLSFGPDVIVLAPECLREQVAKAATATARVYLRQERASNGGQNGCKADS